MIEQIMKYANHINASDEVLFWIKTTGRKSIIKKLTNESNLEHIIDFLVSSDAPKRLQKMSFKDAKKKAKEWNERNQKKGKNLVDSSDDIEIIHTFSDSTKIVKLKTKKSLQREGFLMRHCVGGYTLDSNDLFIYSYRDENNLPHATFEVRKNRNEIVQIKGKGNGPIHPKYIYPILEFLKIIGMEIRPNDMVNLGYYHINKDNLEFLKNIKDAWKQIVTIAGEFYAHD